MTSNSFGLCFKICALTLVALNCIACTQDEQLDLKLLCRDESKSSRFNNDFPLTRISQLQALVDQLSLEEELSCSQKTRLAIVDLNELISDKQNVCTAEKVEQIKRFYENYIEQNKTNGHQQQQQQQQAGSLPKWLENFFLAYSLRVSGLCKMNMITSLLLDGSSLLTDRDFAALEDWTNDESIIASLMNEPGDYDDLILPRDLMRAFIGAQLDEVELEQRKELGDKLVMQTLTGDVITKIQFVCERRFRPIYEKLILPLVSLSNLGFNYQGEELKVELREMSVNKKVHQWYRIVYICESLNSIEIVTDKQFAAEHQTMDKSVVRVLNKEEARKLKEKNTLLKSDVEQQASQFNASNETEQNLTQKLEQQFKQLSYRPEYAILLSQDEVLKPNDGNLVRQIRQFDSNKSEMDRIRDRLWKKVAKFLLQSLQRGQLKIIGSFLAQSGADSQENTNNQLVRAIDQMVNNKALATSGLDKPVAGAFSKALGAGKRYYNHAAYQGPSGLLLATANKAQSSLSPSRRFLYIMATVLMVLGIVLLCMHAG